MQKEFLYILFLPLFLFSCIATNKEGRIIHNDSLQTIYFDEIPKEDFLKASLLFKTVKPIILETRGDVLIGRVGGVYVIDNLIVVYDDSPRKAIWVFDFEGNFLRKIGKIGAGPGEYLNISDFTVDKENKEIYILDQLGHKINKYNLLSGEFINSIGLKKGRYPRHIQYAFHSLFIDANLKTDEQKLIYKIDLEDGKDICSWLDADIYNRGWMETASLGNSFFFSRNTDQPKYANIFMDTVMTIQDEVLVPFFTLKSERWVTNQELQEAYAESGLDADFVMRQNNRVFGMTGLMECQDCILFTIWDGYDLFSVYNSADQTKLFRMFKDDLVYITEQFPINNMQCADTKGVYACASPQEFAFFAGVDLKDILNPDIARYDELIRLPEDANPVLFYYELKEKGERF